MAIDFVGGGSDDSNKNMHHPIMESHSKMCMFMAKSMPTCSNIIDATTAYRTEREGHQTKNMPLHSKNSDVQVMSFKGPYRRNKKSGTKGPPKKSLWCII
jgi:hypothetical protein